jgi:hypothetical protein
MALYTPWTLKCGNSGFQPQIPGTFESFSSQDWLVRGQLSAVGFWSVGERWIFGWWSIRMFFRSDFPHFCSRRARHIQ